MTKHDATMKSS